MLVSEFNSDKIKILYQRLIEIYDSLSKELDKLENETIIYNNSMKDKTAIIATNIVNEYKRVIKDMKDTTNQKINAVKSSADIFEDIEVNEANNLRSSRRRY